MTILDLPDMISRHIEPEPTSGCWLWTGNLYGTGYGRLRRGAITMRAHRVVWQLLRGPIAAGLTLDHLCRNRPCCNPDHMDPVSLPVNILRGNGAPAMNARKTHCPRGHALGGTNAFPSATIRGERGACRECSLANDKTSRNGDTRSAHA